MSEETETGSSPATSDAAEATGEASGLAASDFELLAFESRRWRSPLIKQRRIRQELGMEPRAYFRRLQELLESEAAWEQFPDTLDAVRARLEESQAHYALWESAFPRTQQAPSAPHRNQPQPQTTEEPRR